ncbi:MAG: disulfide bond formation protein B [Brachymonas sp.]|nr:disulfide bond formation protein B [Brachymonas sp.]
MQSLIRLFFATPRRTLWWIAGAIFGSLAFGMYLQYAVGLVPCPMCIVQRYVFVLLGLLALVGALFPSPKAHVWTYIAMIPMAVAGAFVAARQSWLQWNPPAVSSCGRDFYGMIEQLPLSRALPMIFAGSGDCTKVDWTFLGGTIANWAFVCFVAVIITSMAWLWAMRKKNAGFAPAVI